MCSKPIFCSKVVQKGKICSRLLEPQKAAPNAKSCSKVALGLSRFCVATFLHPPFRYSSALPVRPGGTAPYRKCILACIWLARIYDCRVSRRMFSYKWAMSLNWTVKGHNELNVELHYGEADELRHQHRFGHPDIPSEVKTENMVDWRSFAVTFLLHAWIVPKFVCSQHKCLGGFDIYFILDRWAICNVERFNQSGKKRTFPISHTVLLCLVLSAQ